MATLKHIAERFEAEIEAAVAEIENRHSAELADAHDATAREVARADRLGERIQALHVVVGGNGDLLERVRALKTRCAGADQAASTMHYSDYVSDLRRHLDAAQRLAHDETVRADGWKERATVAESALAERNREVDLLKRQAQSAGEVRDSLLEQIDAQRDLANTLRAQLAKETDHADKNGQAIHRLAATVTTLAQERDSLKAQAEILRGGADWRIGMHGVNHDASMRIIRALVAALPFPSPKTGQWRCRRPGCCAVISTAEGWIGGSIGPGPWSWDEAAGAWTHWCPGHDTTHPADRIGDAPEVSP